MGACDQLFGLTTVTRSDAQPAGDVLGIDGLVVDAPLDGASEWGFASGAPIAALTSSAGDGDPTLTSDMTEIYFKSSRTGGAGLEDLWYSTRSSAAGAWSAPQRSILSTAEYENQPRISSDGLTLYFRRGAGSTAKLMVATRASAKNDAGWSTPVQITELDATDTHQDAGLMSTTPLVGYLMSKRSGTVRVYRTTRANVGGTWSTPAILSELMGDKTYEQSPWVTPDQLSMIFASDRTGCKGGGDLWLARRSATDAPFGTPICLFEVSSFGFDGDPWISPDLRHIYYTSIGSGGYDLFEAHR